MGKLRKKEAIWAWIFLLPNLTGFLIFVGIPIIAALVLSFYRWDLMTPPKFIGFKNFLRLFHEPLFKRVIWNTVYFTLGTVLPSLAAGLGLAILLDRKFRGVHIYRACFYLPQILPMVAAGLIFQFLYMPDFGFINFVLGKLHLPQPNWLNDVSTAMLAIVIMSIWKSTGFNMVIYLAGLNGIPDSLYEAAQIDGANDWQRFRFITLPLLSPTTFFALAISLIGSFQVFDQIYVMTRGGPADATRTIVYYIYETGFQYFRMGKASAAAWILFLIVFATTILQFRYQGEWVHYEQV
ncbi:MAG: sugar ABC transporter permease [Candidatus Atribacteria bacterium]|nr:sugar ABC transporter permease [Candidatus Atribacteria bacterium]MCD6350132.1 sugar ABC transporter permease [Candidatus Atribacteria bacterium]